MNSSLTLDGKYFNRKELREYAATQLRESTAPWKQELFNFILYWTDDTEISIEVPTSGSTGPPKPVRITKQQMINSAVMTQSYLGLKEKDTALLCLPVRYIAGKMMVVRAFTGKLDLYTISPAADPLSGFNASSHIDFCAMTPMQVHYSLSHSHGRDALQGISSLIIGGGSIPLPLRETLSSFSNKIFETYGMTETISHIAMRKIAPKAAEYFETLPGISIDTDERECLKIAAPALSSVPLITNDVVQIHHKDQFTWLGRADHVINSGGIKVHPEQMESLLAAHIEGRFAISSRKDRIVGEKVVLVLEQSPMKEEKERSLLEGLRKSISLPVYPKVIAYLEVFPETGSGKIDRPEIRKRIN